jgi:hypothetical protein
MFKMKISFEWLNREKDFDGYIGSEGEWIYNRTVVITPFKWIQGTGLTIEVIEYYNTTEEGNKTRIVQYKDCYDKDYGEDVVLFQGINNLHITFNAAESLLWEWFVNNHFYTIIKEYFPKQSEYIIKQATKYNYLDQLGPKTF